MQMVGESAARIEPAGELPWTQGKLPLLITTLIERTQVPAQTDNGSTRLLGADGLRKAGWT
jgi:hypothetical protein